MCATFSKLQTSTGVESKRIPLCFKFEDLQSINQSINQSTKAHRQKHTHKQTQILSNNSTICNHEVVGCVVQW